MEARRVRTGRAMVSFMVRGCMAILDDNDGRDGDSKGIYGSPKEQ